MARQEAENSNSLSIFWLKKYGYLEDGLRWGGIKWTYGFYGRENNINFTTSINRDGNDYIELHYINTNRATDERDEMDYKVFLTTTSCNFGGKRYWFVCPLSKNGRYCGRRVGVIYSIGKWFGCRYCADIAYRAQFDGGKFRAGSVCEPDVEKAYGEVKLKYYKGKPTKKYRRYLRLRQKMDNCWIRAAKHFGMEF